MHARRVELVVEAPASIDPRVKTVKPTTDESRAARGDAIALDCYREAPTL
jgi:hypothetical protein